MEMDDCQASLQICIWCLAATSASFTPCSLQAAVGRLSLHSMLDSRTTKSKDRMLHLDDETVCACKMLQHRTTQPLIPSGSSTT